MNRAEEVSRLFIHRSKIRIDITLFGFISTGATHVLIFLFNIGAINMKSLDDIHSMLPDMDGFAYFQTSGFSPKLLPVVDEVIHWFRFQSRGPALQTVSQKSQEMFEEARNKVASSINGDPGEIVLSENTTVGINIVANGIDWKPGDNVILSSHEHPGNRLTWYNIADRYGVNLKYLRISNDPTEMLEELKTLIDEATRLISISHVSRRTGVRIPAKEMGHIAHAKDVPVLWDGAQSFGAIPINVRDLNCDFYSFCGHKYIMAPQGTGALYIRKDRIDWLKPSWIGSHSQESFGEAGEMKLLDEAKRFEFGTRNMPDQAGFAKALKIWAAIGWDTVFERLESYTDQLKDALSMIDGVVLETPMAYGDSSGIVTFHIPGMNGAGVLKSLSDREKVLGSPLEFNEESMRISTHVFNTEEHADRLLSGIKRVLMDGVGVNGTEDG